MLEGHRVGIGGVPLPTFTHSYLLSSLLNWQAVQGNTAGQRKDTISPVAGLHFSMSHLELQQALPAGKLAQGFVRHWCVVASHTFPVVQVPHEPPQPSLPQVFPVQSGVQVGAPGQARGCDASTLLALETHPYPFLDASHPQYGPPASEGQSQVIRPQPLGAQKLSFSPVQQFASGMVGHWALTHWLKSLLHTWPNVHVPQVPPQPSSPHVLPVHCGTQALQVPEAVSQV